MRKLLTMMAAVASAIGLYAADSGALSGTSFEGLNDGDGLNITDPTGELTLTGGFWRTNGTDTLTIKAGTSVVEGSENRSKAFEPEYENTRYMSIKTESPTNSISRYVNVGGGATNINDGAATGLYFDSFVKFTAFDSDPDINLGSNGKLAIWLKEEGEEGNLTTNLVITAGYLDSNLQAGAVVTNYNCAVVRGVNFNDGGWHRVTVKAIDSIYNNVGGTTPGFVVFIDRNYVYCTDDTTMGISGSLKGTASKWNGVKALFPSACQDGADKDSISAVDFAGQGDVDELVFTRTAPFDDAEDVGLFTIQVGEGVAKVTFTTNGVSEEITSNKSLTLDNAWTTGGITITATYDDGYVADTWDGLSPESGNLFKPDTDGQYVQVRAKLAGATVNGVGYETLADAIEAANLSSSDCTVKLASDATTKVEIDNTSAVITLDLAGYSITGTGNSEVIYVEENSTLIITNTGDTVGHVIPGATEDAVFSYGNLVITAGKYDGKVDISQGQTASITGGGFLVSATDSSTLADLNAVALSGYELTADGDYYVLTEASNYVAQIGGTGYETFAAALAAATDGDTITLLADVTEEPFTIPVAKFEVQGLTIDLDGNTYTFDGGSGDGIYLLSSNKLTIANGTLAAASGTAYRDLVRDYNSALTLNNVTVDGANFPATDGTKLACLLCIEGGGANILGNTSIINVKSEAYAIKMGNHAQAWYEMGTTTVNTTGNIMGNVLIAGGVYDEVAVGSASTINYYYGKNVHSTWEDGVSSTIFAARTGTLPTAAGTQDNVSGQLFKQFTGAFTASDEFTLLADYDGDVTFTMDTRITANGYELTGTLSAPAGYEVRDIEGVYQAARPIYTITFEAGENATVTPATTNYTADSGTIVLPTPTLNGGAVGPTFDGWTNATITAAIKEFTPQAGNLSDFTLYAKWTASGPTYPDYIDTLDDTIKGQYNTWAAANNVTDGTGLEAFFLLNVAPGGLTPVLSSTTFSISGTTVTIDINHGNLNGYPYIKKASTLAGLKTATKESIDVVPADGNNANIDNGGRVTLTGESADAQFYQIGVQSTPVAVPNNSND